MDQTSYCLFETAFGVCGIAWRAPGPVVTTLLLPAASAGRTEAEMAKISGGHQAGRGAEKTPRRISALVCRIQRHLAGIPRDFDDVIIDPVGAGPFARRVYSAARRIPAGQTRTYGEIARALCKPNAARAVGQALGRNPIMLVIPCHRVVAASGRPGGFSAHGGLATKLRILAAEGLDASKLR